METMESLDGTFFRWQDYLLFSLSLLCSLGIGVFFTIRDRNNTSNEEFLMAGRSLSILPVTASTFATIVSSIALVSFPVEVYYFGISFIFMILGMCLCVFPIAEVFIPAYHRMNLTSAFQYLEERFNSTIRKTAAFLQIFLMFLIMGMMTYAPSVSLAQVSGINVWAGIVITTVVCTFYTTFGGMKAVVWADTFQMFLMLAGVVLLAWKSISDLGGWGSAMETIREGGRLDQINWNPNPFMRSGVWSYFIGGFFQALIPLSSSQIAIQRYCTLRTVRQAKISAYLIAPVYLVLGGVILLVGLSMYGHFADCDPLLAGDMQAKDQYVSHLVMQVMGSWPGLPGLYLSCIFAASLSTLSSGQNAVAANVLMDMVKPWYKRRYDKEMPEKKSVIVAKCIAFAVGILVMVASFLTVALGGNLFMLLSKVAGIFAGPLAGLFTIGIVFKSIRNTTLLFVAFLTGTALCLWIGIGAQYYVFEPNHLPLSISGCDWTNRSKVEVDEIFNRTYSLAEEYRELSGFAQIYNLSPLLYGALGYLATVLISVVMDPLIKCCHRGDSVKIYTQSDEQHTRHDKDPVKLLSTTPKSLNDMNHHPVKRKPDSEQEVLFVSERESCL